MYVNPEYIEAENVSRSVSTANERIDILKETSFSIGTGQSAAIVGESGSGKSTLLGLLAGLDIPDTGRIWIDGQDLGAMDEDGRAAVRARHMGFVFQSFHLVPTFTALENVLLPLELNNSEHDCGEAARTLLERVGLRERLRHYPAQLSGGEQQRVALARAFANTPDILFADEPTGNLDARSSARIIELMFDMNAEFRTTLVLVTHEQTLARRCDRLLQLADGVIRETQ